LLQGADFIVDSMPDVIPLIKKMSV
jgi:hypothetical protein